MIHFPPSKPGWGIFSALINLQWEFLKFVRCYRKKYAQNRGNFYQYLLKYLKMAIHNEKDLSE